MEDPQKRLLELREHLRRPVEHITARTRIREELIALRDAAAAYDREPLHSYLLLQSSVEIDAAAQHERSQHQLTQIADELAGIDDVIADLGMEQLDEAATDLAALRDQLNRLHLADPHDQALVEHALAYVEQQVEQLRYQQLAEIPTQTRGARQQQAEQEVEWQIEWQAEL